MGRKGKNEGSPTGHKQRKDLFLSSYWSWCEHKKAWSAQDEGRDLPSQVGIVKIKWKRKGKGET